MDRGSKVEWAHNSQMLAVKDERKRAEYDVQLLANRLNYLRQEERMASRKVAETRKRAEDVAAAKRNSSNHDKLKSDWRQSCKAREDASREFFTHQRRENKAKLRSAREDMLRSRKEAAEEARRARKEVEDQKTGWSAAEQARRKESQMTVSAIRDRKRVKEEKRRAAAEEALRRQAEARVAEEKRRKDEAEKLIAKFEEEEARLIERLKQTQVDQHGALTQLEKTILTP